MPTNQILPELSAWRNRAEKAEKELAEARQIVNEERHILLSKIYCFELSKNEENRLEYLQRKIKDWWHDEKRLKGKG